LTDGDWTTLGRRSGGSVGVPLGEAEMLNSESKKVVFGLLVLLAIVGNAGVVQAVAAAQEVSIPGWVSVAGAILVLIPELLLLSALTAQTG
jgi:hypothetical protein